MAWYEGAKSNIQVQAYNPTDTRRGIAAAEANELQNTATKYKNQQQMNMDSAFTDTVEKKKTVDPNTGAVTYSLYLDPDKYAQSLFQKSKETGVPFDMQAAKDYSAYALGRMQSTSQMAGQKTAQEQQGIKVEGKPNPTSTTQVKGSVPPGSAGDKRKDKNGTEWTFDGTGWYIEQTPGGF